MRGLGRAARGRTRFAVGVAGVHIFAKRKAGDPGMGCTLAACVSEIARQDKAIVTAYAGGFRRMSDLLRQALPAGTPPDEAGRRAIALLTGMVGALAVARALEKADPELSRDVLAAAREELKRLAFEPASAPEAG